MADLWLEPYGEALAEFPATGSSSEKFKAALARAVRAPSVHNTQPWWCRIRGETLEIHADSNRKLRVSDPNGRELMMSCGALVEYLTIALYRFGQAHDLQVLPTTDLPDLVARVTLGDIIRPDPDAIVLYHAIGLRRTNRRSFHRRPVPRPILELAASHAKSRGARLLIVEDPAQRTVLAELIAEADRIQLADDRFRRELARWLRVPKSRARDGIPAVNGKAPLALRPVVPLVVRTFDVGAGIAAQDRRVAGGSPVLGLLGTRADDRAAWVSAGRALARVLLSLAANGVATSFLNQPIEVPEIRARLRWSLGRGTHSQVVLRAGYAERDVPETPRRPLSDILRR
jgi:hypothetical protein